MRVGNKKPDTSVNKTVKTGKVTSGNNSGHVTSANKVVIGGKGIHGMPLMSAAAAKVKG